MHASAPRARLLCSRTAGSGCFQSLLIFGLQALVLSLFFGRANATAAATANLTIPANAPEVVYSPFLCNTTESAKEGACLGGWKTFNTTGGGTLVSTECLPKASGAVPQAFLTFQATSLFIRTSTHSNATVNVTLSSFALHETISSTLDTTTPLISVVNLPADAAVSLTITCDSHTPAQLELESFELGIPGDCASCTSIFPTSTPATQSSTSTSASSTMTMTFPTHTSSSNTSKKQRVATIVGGTFAGILGILLLIGIALFVYLYRRRRRRVVPMQHQPDLATPSAVSLAEQPHGPLAGESRDGYGWLWRWRWRAPKSKDEQMEEGSAAPDMAMADDDPVDTSPHDHLFAGTGGANPGFGPGIGAPIRMRGGSLTASFSISVSDVGTRGAQWSTAAVEAGGDPEDSSHSQSHSRSMSLSASAIGVGLGGAATRGSSNVAVEGGGDEPSPHTSSGENPSPGGSRLRFGMTPTRASSNIAVEAGGDDSSRSGSARAASNVAVEDART